MCEYQSDECAFTSPVSIEYDMLVTCCMQCVMAVLWCCIVVMLCLLVESICIGYKMAFYVINIIYVC